MTRKIRGKRDQGLPHQGPHVPYSRANTVKCYNAKAQHMQRPTPDQVRYLHECMDIFKIKGIHKFMGTYR